MPVQTTPGLPDPVAAVRFATALAKAPARRGEAVRERGRLAVELAGIAVVVSQPGLPDLQLNDAAHALLGGIL
jgi:hypothetical protein